jgi:hypothetical protein
MSIEQTNDETFSSVFDRDSSDMGADPAAPSASERARDDKGRFASDAPVEPVKVEADTPAVEPETPESPDRRMVPLKELLNERGLRKAEADARARAETERAEYERQLQAYRQQQQPQQQQNYAQQIDPIVDPDGFAASVREDAIRQVVGIQLNQSEARARAQYGHEVTNQALQFATQTGAKQYFTEAAFSGRTADAWGDLVAWYQKQQAIAKIGDPAEFEAKIREDERKKALATQQPPTAPTRFPGSLADATATGPQGNHLSIEQAAASVFAREPRRR